MDREARLFHVRHIPTGEEFLVPAEQVAYVIPCKPPEKDDKPAKGSALAS